MLRGTWILPLLLAAACSTSNKQDKDTAPTAGPAQTGAIEHIPMTGGPSIGAPGGGNATPGSAAKGPASDDARLYLHADEGTLTVDKATGKAGNELVSKVSIVPTSEFHVNTEFPIKLTLEPADGVTFAKSEYTAGGASKSAGDATAFTEKGLDFAVKATAAKPGSYEVKGTFKFAVCKESQCLPKKQPITITIDAT